MNEEDYFYEIPHEKENIASLQRRIAAFIIDLIFFYMVFYPLFMQSFQLTSGFRDELLTPEYLSIHPEILNLMIAVLTSSSIIFCFYMSVSEYFFEKTIGKHFLGLRIKGKTSLLGFVSRNLLKSTLFMILPFDLLGIIFYNQRLIDKALNIKVIYNKNFGLMTGFI